MPLVDRIDQHIEVPAVPYEEMRADAQGAASDQMRKGSSGPAPSSARPLNMRGRDSAGLGRRPCCDPQLWREPDADSDNKARRQL